MVRCRRTPTPAETPTSLRGVGVKGAGGGGAGSGSTTPTSTGTVELGTLGVSSPSVLLPDRIRSTPPSPSTVSILHVLPHTTLSFIPTTHNVPPDPEVRVQVPIIFPFPVP